MDSFVMTNGVRLEMSQALLLLYRYLTGIYVLGDLSFVQFLGGFLRGQGGGLDESEVLTVSGNGIGELEKMLCLQWQTSRLDTMAVKPSHMRIMRFLQEATAEDVSEFFGWARDSVDEYPSLKGLLDSEGLLAYWQQQCELWRSAELTGRVRLLGGSPWNMPATETYDVVILSHAQTLLFERDARDILAHLNPNGFLVALMPVVFGPKNLRQDLPARFSDLPEVQQAKSSIRDQARNLGHEIPDKEPAQIMWVPVEDTTSHVVSFSIATPLRSLLIGELLILSLEFDLQDAVRMQLLESVLSSVSPSSGAGTEALLILISQKGAQ